METKHSSSQSGDTICESYKEFSTKSESGGGIEEGDKLER
jgi:hypothetical protein